MNDKYNFPYDIRSKNELHTRRNYLDAATDMANDAYKAIVHVYI